LDRMREEDRARRAADVVSSHCVMTFPIHVVL
jgi:hypothetical protein